jgi:hypothetical protein
MSVSVVEITENQKPCIGSNGVIFIPSFKEIYKHN